jgi:hypothetical protein
MYITTRFCRNVTDMLFMKWQIADILHYPEFSPHDKVPRLKLDPDGRLYLAVKSVKAKLSLCLIKHKIMKISE